MQLCKASPSLEQPSENPSLSTLLMGCTPAAVAGVAVPLPSWSGTVSALTETCASEGLLHVVRTPCLVAFEMASGGRIQSAVAVIRAAAAADKIRPPLASLHVHTAISWKFCDRSLTVDLYSCAY